MLKNRQLYGFLEGGKNARRNNDGTDTIRKWKAATAEGDHDCHFRPRSVPSFLKEELSLENRRATLEIVTKVVEAKE